jgi:hypothetical protein
LIDLAIINLSCKFLRDANTRISFTEGTTYLSKFLECSKSGYLKNSDKDGDEYLHELIFKEVPFANEVPEKRRAQGMRPCIDGSLDACITLTKDYIQAIVDGLNARFPDLPLFNATKLFSPCHYAGDTSIREANAKRWLDKLLDHLQPDSNHDGNGNVLFDRNGCNCEFYGFIDTMHLNCESFTMQEAWRVFCRMKDWQVSFPNIMKLWQAILVIPVSTVQCERGFSKQNTIKDIGRSNLSVEMLDALMRVSLTGPKIENVDFDRVFEIWKTTKDRRILDL